MAQPAVTRFHVVKWQPKLYDFQLGPNIFSLRQSEIASIHQDLASCMYGHL